MQVLVEFMCRINAKLLERINTREEKAVKQTNRNATTPTCLIFPNLKSNKSTNRRENYICLFAAVTFRHVLPLSINLSMEADKT